MCGDAGAGKTSVLKSALGLEFDPCEDATMNPTASGFSHVYNGVTIKLQIWDIAGLDTWLSFCPLFYHGAVGAIMVYDVTDPGTFESLQRWVCDFKLLARENPSIVVVGNKSDREEPLRVSYLEGVKWCKECGYDFLEASAKTGENARRAFELLAERIAERAPRGPLLCLHPIYREAKSRSYC
jgi:small GTP-binding protein